MFTRATRRMLFVSAAAVLLSLAPVAAKQNTDFGRMFPDLPPFQPDDQLLVGLAAAMQDANLAVNDNPDGVPSGFTYLGQFLDHDLTLDATPLGDANVDVDAMVNGRTAKLDLDSMYGGGQIGSPQLYAGAKFTFSRPNGFDDLQRTESGQAVLVEGRNDENLIIAQIHVAFQKFHNAWIDSGLKFSAAQRMVQWHWQWLVVHEFLPHITSQDTVDALLAYNGAGKPRFVGTFYDAGNKKRPMMPLEFSAAAYRFGHSMVRLAYVLPTGSTTKTQVFNAAGNDLHGSRPIPPELKIDFNNFFDIPGNPVPPGRNVSRKIDSLVSKSLYFLPIGPVVPPDPPAVTSLPERNLLRGKRLGLPSYQDVATALGLTPYTNAQLDPDGTLGLTNPAWGGKAPLWFGILKESELAENGARLGPTGRRIVAEVILGIIDADKDSYFHSPQAWKPAGGSFGMADLLTFAGAVQ
ncbi:MAG TPA: heme peroxidase family protein [Vicinamibacterales bacterium]|nr:heme peroxidase family protein [Vicinamibacterales bacterium]